MKKVNLDRKEFEIFITQKVVELAERYNKIQYLTLREAAGALKVSQRTLTRLVQDGYIDCYRIPSKMGEKRNYRFKLSDIEDFMNQQKILCTSNIVKNAFKTKNIDRNNINKMVKNITTKNN